MALTRCPTWSYPPFCVLSPASSQRVLYVGGIADLWLAQIVCLSALFNNQHFLSEVTHLWHCWTIIPT